MKSEPGLLLLIPLVSSHWPPPPGDLSSGLAPLTQAVNLWVISALCFVSVALSGLGKIVEMNASILCLGWAWLLVGTLVQLSLSTYLGTHLWHVWGLGGGTGCSSLFLPLLSYLHWQCGCEGSLGSGRSAFGKRSTSIHMPGKTLQCGQKSIAVGMVVEKQADVWADSAGRSLRQRLKSFRSVWATGQDLISTAPSLITPFLSSTSHHPRDRT